MRCWRSRLHKKKRDPPGNSPEDPGKGWLRRQKGDAMVSKVVGLACSECGSLITSQDPVVVCPDCGAIFCAACAEAGALGKHECEENDIDD